MFRRSPTKIPSALNKLSPGVDDPVVSLVSTLKLAEDIPQTAIALKSELKSGTAEPNTAIVTTAADKNGQLDSVIESRQNSRDDLQTL